MRAVILALLVNAILSQSPLEDATAYIDQLFLYPIPTNSNNIKVSLSFLSCPLYLVLSNGDGKLKPKGEY